MFVVMWDEVIDVGVWWLCSIFGNALKEGNVKSLRKWMASWEVAAMDGETHYSIGSMRSSHHLCLARLHFHLPLCLPCFFIHILVVVLVSLKFNVCSNGLLPSIFFILHTCIDVFLCCVYAQFWSTFDAFWAPMRMSNLFKGKFWGWAEVALSLMLKRHSESHGYCHIL